MYMGRTKLVTSTSVAKAVGSGVRIGERIAPLKRPLLNCACNLNAQLNSMSLYFSTKVLYLSISRLLGYLGKRHYDPL